MRTFTRREIGLMAVGALSLAEAGCNQTPYYDLENMINMSEALEGRAIKTSGKLTFMASMPSSRILGCHTDNIFRLSHKVKPGITVYVRQAEAVISPNCGISSPSKGYKNAEVEVSGGLIKVKLKGQETLVLLIDNAKFDWSNR
jgi:hypothetical protein